MMFIKPSKASGSKTQFGGAMLEMLLSVAVVAVAAIVACQGYGQSVQYTLNRCATALGGGTTSTLADDDLSHKTETSQSPRSPHGQPVVTQPPVQGL